MFLKGAIIGGFLGYSWFLIKPLNPFVTKKLMNVVGDRNWSGRTYRFMREVISPYALVGGVSALGYTMIYEFLRGAHEQNNDRPMYYDHTIATTAMFALGGFLYGLNPTHVLTGTLLSVFLVCPMSWWVYKHGKLNPLGKTVNIYYQNDVSKDEIERI